MKITDIEIIPIALPLAKRYDNHHGKTRMYDIDQHVVVKITTDNGIVGYGDYEDRPTISQAEIEPLIDRNPFDFINNNFNMAIGMALYDVMGKYLEVPAYKLMGQKLRDAAPVCAWTRPCAPEIFANEIQRAVDQGYRIFKMHSDARHDIIEQTRAAQEVAPQGFKLHWDLNHNRPSAAVLRIVDELEKFPVVGFLEDPFFWHDIEGWRLLRSQTMLPILMHVPQLGGGPEIQREVADLYMIGENGLGNSIRRGFAAAAAGLSTVIQLTGGTLSKAMAMHLGAVVPNVSHATTLDDQYAEDVTGIRLEISEGSSPVPEGPGLGVDVDEKILAELAARPKSELPRHLGVLHLPGGTTYYTPSAPNVEQITGFVEGNVRGIRSEFWNDDSSEEFSRVYEQVQKEGTVKKG